MKKLVALILALVIAISFCGCQNKEEINSENELQSKILAGMTKDEVNAFNSMKETKEYSTFKAVYHKYHSPEMQLALCTITENVNVPEWMLNENSVPLSNESLIHMCENPHFDIKHSYVRNSLTYRITNGKFSKEEQNRIFDSAVNLTSFHMQMALLRNPLLDFDVYLRILEGSARPIKGLGYNNNSFMRRGFINKLKIYIPLSPEEVKKLNGIEGKQEVKDAADELNVQYIMNKGK